jgi:hypothetical protein
MTHQEGSHFTSTPRDAGNARAVIVNRTHRVVRQRAAKMQAMRSQQRGLMFPLLLCSMLLVAVCYAVWSVFEQFEVSPAGGSEASSHFVLLLWFLPVSLVALGAVLLRSGRDGADDEAAR